jgi:hypothetical protein
VHPQTTGAKDTELRGKIAKISADYRRLRDACTDLLSAIASDPRPDDAKIGAAAVVVANAMLQTPTDPEAP